MTAALLTVSPLRAQQSPAGTLQGRVFDARARNVMYLENARVVIAGTKRETYTDQDGRYRFVDVPAGSVTLNVSFTGLESRAESVLVAPRGVTEHDIGLSEVGAAGRKGGDVVKLDAYTVAESREMSNSLIAMNEERFSPNLKTIVGTDEFGVMPSDDMGELMKMMPGLAMAMTDGEPAAPNVDGVGSENVPVTAGGFEMSSAGQGTTTREVRLTHLSLNNFSRIEIVRSPTPESPGNALAGTVNLVPRSAFERQHAVYNFSTYLTMRADEAHLEKTLGPRRDSWKVLPGVDFSAVVPVNRRFGFSVSGNLSKTYKRRDYLQNTWRGTYNTTNGTTFPHTTPDMPYLSAFSVKDGQLFSTRKAFAVTGDIRLTDIDQLSISISDSRRNSEYDNRALDYTLGSVPAGAFTSRYTHTTAANSSLQIDTEDRDYDNRTFMPTVLYRHNGALWKVDSGVAYSNSTAFSRGPDRGFITTTTMRRTGVGIQFDDVSELGPRTITVKDATGATVDPFDANSYALTAASAAQNLSTDVKRMGFANVSRVIDALPFPALIKAGGRYNHSKRDNNFYLQTNSTSFVGADGIGSTTPAGDDDAGPYAWTGIAGRMGAFGFPAVPTVDAYRMYDLFRSNPEYFKETAVSRYNRIVSNSKVAREQISAGYIEGDVRLFNQRLRLVGGVRFEETQVSGAGPKEDPTANYQRTASGDIVRDSKGNPVLIYPATSLEARQLIYTMRGSRVQTKYHNYFPSINGIYTLTSNLQMHAAYFTSIGRPGFGQYVNEVDLPDLEENPSAANRFTLSNPGIQPWTAKTVTAAIEYYFKRSGRLSLSVFRRDIRNFFGSVVTPATPEFLAVYGIDDPAYLNYDVATQYNLSGVKRMLGFTLAYKQALTFLPEWARGVSVFANLSHQENKNADTQFALIPYYGSAGIALNRARWGVNLNYTWRDEQFQSNRTGTGIAPGTVFYVAAQGSLDLSIRRRLTSHFSFVARMTDLLDEDHKLLYYNSATPGFARLRQIDNFGGGVWTFSIQGAF